MGANRKLPDYIRPGLKVLFVGINPGLRSSRVGHHFAGHSNRFWKLLYESGLVTDQLTCRDDWRLPQWGLGLTNVISRTTAGIDVLRPHEYRAGVVRLRRKVTRYRPKIVALLGLTIFRSIFPPETQTSSRLSLGPQTARLAGVPVFLLPNPSGRNAHYSYRHMLAAFQDLRRAARRERTHRSRPLSVKADRES
jgi:TDG/mug DNA glycosylase family protein